MRVVLRRRRDDDERGVVAILVAMLAITLLVMSAIVIDFGTAYVNKRQAQTAADAGALAAAKVYANADASCATGTVVGGSFSEAQAEAEAVRQENFPGSKPGTLAAVCEDGAVKVSYDVQADSDVGLGQLVIDADHITVARHAAVKWSTSQSSVGGLRPWMVCSAQIPSGGLPSAVVAIGLPGNGHLPTDANCDNPNKPGDWWRTTCYNSGGAHGETEQNVLTGCDTVEIVPGQDPTDTPAERSSYLQSMCGPESHYCLHDDSGRDVKTLADEWDTLLGETIAMPVFCAGTDCDPTSVTRGGNWPVWKIAAVTVCGYAMKGKVSSVMPAGDCTTSNTSGLSTATFTKDDIGFLLIFEGLIEAGGPTTFPVEVDTRLRLVE